METNVDEVWEKLSVLQPHDGVLPSCNSRGGWRWPQSRGTLKTRWVGEANMKARADTVVIIDIEAMCTMLSL